MTVTLQIILKSCVLHFRKHFNSPYENWSLIYREKSFLWELMKTHKYISSANIKTLSMTVWYCSTITLLLVCKHITAADTKL